MALDVSIQHDETQTLINAYLDVHESQAIFRILIDTMSRPGIVSALPTSISTRIEPVILPLLALLGHETPFCILAPNSDFLSQIVSRTTNAVAVPLSQASFIASTESLSDTFFDQICIGKPDRPDFAAQIVVTCSAISNERLKNLSHELILSGPGVDGETHLYFETAQPSVFKYLTHRPHIFPMGCDIWFVSNAGIITAIPRTTVVTIANGEL